MRQRVMIAMALAAPAPARRRADHGPRRDHTGRYRPLGDPSRARLLLITHDLGVVAEMADEVGVMYAGRIVGARLCGLCSPNRAIPILGALSLAPTLDTPLRRLDAIPGTVPSPGDLPQVPLPAAARKRMNAVSRLRPSSNCRGRRRPEVCCRSEAR
ncbi:MAG: hypothetical protein ACLSHC_13235 [Bilophila wadsworthia]